MKMIPVVNSSNVKAYGWEANIIMFEGSIPKDVLRIEFLNGMIYDYVGVSKETFDEFERAESKGSFLHRKILQKYQAIQRA